jgi:predicted nucleotidyltransferase
LRTSAGDLDLLGEATGGGTYEALLPQTELRDVLGQSCRFVNLETLIRLKRAAGRPKDLERVAELEALRAERERPDA